MESERLMKVFLDKHIERKLAIKTKADAVRGIFSENVRMQQTAAKEAADAAKAAAEAAVAAAAAPALQAAADPAAITAAAETASVDSAQPTTTIASTSPSHSNSYKGYYGRHAREEGR